MEFRLRLYIHSTHRVTITDGVNQTQLTQTPTSTPISAADEFNILPIALFLITALAAVSLIIVGLKRKNPNCNPVIDKLR